MNIEVESQPNCLKTLRIDLPGEEVKRERDSIAAEFRKNAKLPGYRPGKAPAALVEKRYQKQIEDELSSRLVSQATREAIRTKELRVLEIEGVEEVNISEEHGLTFTARVLTAPEFELPEYKGLTVEVPEATVTDEEIDGTLENLQRQHSEFKDINDRPAAMGDFLVVDWESTLDGKPLAEALPEAGAFFQDRKDFWLAMEEESFLPGFCSHLIDMKNGEEKEFDLELPADFGHPDLAGKTLHYKVRLQQIKEQVLPELNDELASRIVPEKNLEEVRELIREEMLGEKRTRVERATSDQIMNKILEQADFELPQRYVQGEARRIAEDIVRSNQQRGASEEELLKHEERILAASEAGGRQRVKSMFLLGRIAAKEKLKAEPAEIEARIQQMALRYNMPPEKLRKELESRKALDQVEQEVLFAKVLDFLKANATVQTISEEEYNQKQQGAVPAPDSTPAAT